jgi:hypothetical protein
MKTSEKILNLVEYGMKASTLIDFSDKQINLLHKKLVESQKETKEITMVSKNNSSEIAQLKQGNKTFEVYEDDTIESENGIDFATGYNKDEFGGNLPLDFNNPEDYNNDDPEGKMDGMGESEIKEKSFSQQQQKLMGLALSVKKGKTPKSEVSKKIKDVAKSMSEKDLEDFASTKHKGLPKKVESKENYMNMVGKAVTKANLLNLDKISPSVKYESELEKKVVSLVEKHIPAKMTKKDLLNLLEGWEEEDDVIVKPSKPTTKPGPTIDPDDPYQPAPDVEPVPRAGEEDDDVIVKPKRPITKPKPTIDPDDPYQPAPDVEPVPRAEKDKLPKWFSFDELGLQFKK